MFEAFWSWAKKIYPTVLAKTQLGKAFDYAFKRREYLGNYFQNGSCAISNNIAENAIRPFTVGRKNWLFSDTPKGAKASADIYSIVETAKANGLDCIGVAYGYGGEEELGWRGIMQPILEKLLPFPVATVITGTVWGIWHIPLWFVEGSSQQNMAFPFFLVLLALILSLFLWAMLAESKVGQSILQQLKKLHGLVSLFIKQTQFLQLIGQIHHSSSVQSLQSFPFHLPL